MLHKTPSYPSSPSGTLRVLRALSGSNMPGADRLSGLIMKPHPSAPRWWQGVVRRTDGLFFHADTRRHIERQFALRGIYEAHVGEVIRRILKPGDCALDVGANIGAHTVAMADAVGPTGGIVAYEPNPDAANDLERNIALNGFANVTVRRMALGDEDGSAHLHIPAAETPQGSNNGLATIAALQSPHRSVEVQVLRFDSDDIPFPRERIRLVKMDIQGYEPRALKGMEGLLASARPYLLFEFEPSSLRDAGFSAECLLTFLGGHGYRPVDVEHSDRRELTLADFGDDRSREVLAIPEGAPMP